MIPAQGRAVASSNVGWRLTRVGRLRSVGGERKFSPFPVVSYRSRRIFVKYRSKTRSSIMLKPKIQMFQGSVVHPDRRVPTTPSRLHRDPP